MLDLPRTPPAPLTVRDSELVHYSETVWRIYSTTGGRPQSWDAFRSWGPAVDMRWEPHPPPPREQPEHAVYYAAAGVATCVCESFQARRSIDLHGRGPRLTGWRPVTPLRLLDLTGPWPTRNHGSGALGSSPDRRTTCAWAREISTQLPEVDGLYSLSAITQQPALTLWGPRARAALPRRPAFDRELDAVVELLAAVADTYGYGLTG